MSIPAEHMAAIQQLAGEQEADKGAEQGEEEKPPVAPASADVEELKAANKALADRLSRAERLAEEALKRPSTVVNQQPTAQKEYDWDNMTTKDIVGVVIDQIQQSNQQISQAVGFELARIRLEGQIERAAEKYDDFMDYSADIVQKVKEKEGKITPAEAYLLIKAERGETPGKRKEADVKKEDGAERSPTGVRPGSAPAGVRQQKPPANSNEAATRAFKQVFRGR